MFICFHSSEVFNPYFVNSAGLTIELSSTGKSYIIETGIELESDYYDSIIKL